MSARHGMDDEFVLEYASFESPLGWIIIAASAKGISLVDFAGPAEPPAEQIESIIRGEYPGSKPRPWNGSALLEKARTSFLAYLENRKPPAGIPLDVRKGSEFERTVWRAISEIPFGQTRSYKQVAQAAGKPSGARAAGRACGKNPVPIIVPCHRVVATSGKLGGFSGGLDRKSALLKLENSLMDA